MALIAMAVYDTPENGRSELTAKTLSSLRQTVDFAEHRMFISVNAATEETTTAIIDHGERIGAALEVIYNETNIGTARAINKAWKHRQPGENCIKMDNDVVFGRLSNGWVDVLEEAIAREPKVGIIGLKRNDLLESARSTDPNWRSDLFELPHKPGQMDIKVEIVRHVMGTCQMYASALLDKIGYLYQPGIYGFDDSLAGVRCQVAGFFSCFLCNVEIHHIDPGGNEHTQWKRDMAGQDMKEYHRLKAGYLNRTIPIYYDENGNQ